MPASRGRLPGNWLLVIAQAMILPNYIAGFAGLVPFGLLYFLRVAREERKRLRAGKQPPSEAV